MLTPKNRQAIDLYLSGKEPFAGNGTACWQEVYETRSRATAAANWARMLGNASAQVYLEQRQREIDAERAKLIAYDQADAVRDLLDVRNSCMQCVCLGKVARKVKTKDSESGEEIEDIEYADVQGMLAPGEATRAIEQAIRIQGMHPDQQVQGAGVQVAININTEWNGEPGTDPIDIPETPDEPPASEEKPPPVVLIGKR